MSNIKDFKSIADELMSEVNADESLKVRTLQRCGKRRSPIRVFVPAAACAVIAAVMILAVSLLPEGGNNIPDTMMASNSPGVNTSVQPATIEDAKIALGSAFLEPTVIPEGFSMQGVDLTGGGGYVNVTLQYRYGKRSYLIIEEKTQMPLAFEGYKTTDIGGTKGYVISSDVNESAETEVHWIKNGVHYAVMGGLNEAEALDIARSMK